MTHVLLSNICSKTGHNVGVIQQFQHIASDMIAQVGQNDLPFTKHALAHAIKSISRQISAEFGPGWSEAAKFYRGLSRPNDTFIWKELAAIASKKETFRVLELGGGVSYPCLDKHYGSPWILRLASKIFPHMTEGCIADATGVSGWPSRDYCLIKKSPRGKISMRSFHSEGLDPKTLVAAYMQIEPQALLKSATASGSLALATDDLQVRSKSVSNFSIRPWLDPRFEARLAADKITVFANTTWESLLQREDLGNFDLIMGRHLLPLEPHERLNTRRDLLNLKGKLAPAGRLVVTFDDDPAILL